MRRSILLPLALAAALAACAPKLSQQEMAVEEGMIKDRITLWEQCLNSLKPDSMALVYEQSPAFSAAWPDGKRTVSWEEEQQAQRDFAARTTALNFDVQDPVIEILSPTIALTAFSHSADVTDSLSGRALYSGRGTIVWVKDRADQVWRIHRLQVSRTPAPPAPPGRRR